MVDFLLEGKIYCFSLPSLRSFSSWALTAASRAFILRSSASTISVSEVSTSCDYLSTYECKERTSPLILTGVALVVDLLLDVVRVSGVVRVENLDRLPAAGTLVRIVGLERETGQEHRERQTLGVDTSLHQLLLAAKVWVTRDDGEGAAHGSQPCGKNDRVTVLFGPVLQLLELCLARLEQLCILLLFLLETFLLWVVFDVESAGSAVGSDDTCGNSLVTECCDRCDEDDVCIEELNTY